MIASWPAAEPDVQSIDFRGFAGGGEAAKSLVRRDGKAKPFRKCLGGRAAGEILLRLYPHFKITDERFPRVLATRRVFDDGAQYFGAFLPETGVRFLIDFLSKTFRLRTCEIDIDGSVDVPCTQFHVRRCLAPCVASLCDEREYNERVELAASFLKGDAAAIDSHWLAKIESASEEFEFERAAQLRDEWLAIQKIMTSRSWDFSLDDVVDTFETEIFRGDVNIFLVSMRGRRTIGRRAFIYEATEERDIVLTNLLSEFYRFHLPREIRLDGDFEGREDVERRLSERFGVAAKIVVADRRQILATRALGRTKYEHEFKLIKRRKPWPLIADRFMIDFRLDELPRRIECYDVAHISGSDFVAAKSVFVDGFYVGREYEFEFSNEKSELAALAAFVEKSVDESTSLIVVDGGKAQLGAVLTKLGKRKFDVVGAVKPAGKHNDVREFVLKDGTVVPFNGDDPAHRLLQSLRDEAHELANDAHRQRREMAHFYETASMLPSVDEAARRKLLAHAGSLRSLAKIDEATAASVVGKSVAERVVKDLDDFNNGRAKHVEPFVVPLRYVDENGDAADLRPLPHFQPRT